MLMKYLTQSFYLIFGQAIEQDEFDYICVTVSHLRSDPINTLVVIGLEFNFPNHSVITVTRMAPKLNCSYLQLVLSCVKEVRKVSSMPRSNRLVIA